MSEDNEFDWGTKKMKYYQMNKREDNEEENDSDFIEEEKEAIRLQKIRLEKIKKAKILNEEEEESEEKEEKIKKSPKKKKDITNKNDINNDISFKPIEIDNKKIIENINLLKNCLDEYKTIDDEIKILSENKKTNLPKTISYLKEYKNINILYSANILFNIISTLNNKMTGHHPSIKNSAIFNYLINKNSEKNEQIQNNIEQILLYLDKENNKINNNEEIEDNEDLEDMEEDEKIENPENEEENEIEEENEEDDEDEDIESGGVNKNNKDSKDNKKEKNKNISNNLIGKINETVKKPSFLNKKKKREKADKEIDIKENQNFDNEINEDKDEDEDKDKDKDDDDDDSFIKGQYKSFNKLKKEKELLDIKKKENEKKDIEMKNDFAIRKANKEVLKARGIYRKRKRYQGNAKLMNREKFYKKEKQRKKMVKEYEGKPDVYNGEATGIRRDLVRSTKIH